MTTDNSPGLGHNQPPPDEEPPMRPEEFRFWREEVMKLTQPAACALLGISVTALQGYERGKWRDSPKRKDAPAVIPRHVELACAALALGVTRYDGSAEVPMRAHVSISTRKPRRHAEPVPPCS